MKAFLGHTVQAKLPNFHTNFTFTFDKLKRSVTLPTKYIFFSVLKASGDLENLNQSCCMFTGQSPQNRRLFQLISVLPSSLLWKF
jgi:hypothetical protein